MKTLKKKRNLTILALFIILLLGSVYILSWYFLSALSSSYEHVKDNYDEVANTFYKEEESAANDYLYTFYTVRDDVAISASAASYLARIGELELEPSEFGNGYIIKYGAKKNVIPEGAPDYFKECIIDREHDDGSYYYDEGQEMAFSKIRGDFYYVQGSDFHTTDSTSTDSRTRNALDSIADAYDCEILLLLTMPESPDGDFVLCGTSAFSDCVSTDDLGISTQALTQLHEDGSVLVSVKGKLYLALTEKQDPGQDENMSYVVQFNEISKIVKHCIQGSAAPVIMLLLFSITFAVWMLSVCRHVATVRIDNDQYNKYNPRAVKIRTVIVALLAAILIAALTIGEQALENVFFTTIREQTILTEYFDRLDYMDENDQTSAEHADYHYSSNAATISVLSGAYPELQNSGWLREASSIIGSDYITIYDSNGNEVVSSGRYRGMSLGTEEESGTYDFRRLLHGVSKISHTNVEDEITGLTRDMYGVPLEYKSGADAYGAVLVAVDPDISREKNAVSPLKELDILRTMTPYRGFIAGVDPETGAVKVSSTTKRIGDILTPGENGIPSLTEQYMGFANFDGSIYYVCSSERDGTMYYCGTRRSEVFEHIFDTGLFAGIMALIIAAILWLIILKDYNQVNYSKLQEELMVPVTPEEDPDAAPEVTGKRRMLRSRISDMQKFSTRVQASLFRDQTEHYSLSSMSPERKAGTVFTGLLIAFTLLLSYIVFFGERGDSGQNILEYIMYGNWVRGINPFAVAAILFLVFLLVLIFTLLRIIRLVLYGVMDNRARTVSTLVFSIMYYAALIVCVFISLGYLGVDTRALLASAGLVGMGLTLGARDFIADIIAGIVIITDGTYQVGDTVEIGGFRGEVAYLGTRSTTIVGRGDNVKTIRNSTMGDVINYSRLNSWYPLVVTIDSSTPLNEVEDMLRAELPAISEAYPEMITGPEYRGVDSLNGDKISLLILTECRQSDYNYIQREVNREVKLLFEKHNITTL